MVRFLIQHAPNKAGQHEGDNTITESSLETILRRGLGRAVSMVAGQPAASTRPILLDACLHNLAWDKQLEDSRAQYLLNVVLATKEAEWYAEQLVSNLLADDDSLYLYQAFELAALLTKANVADLRPTLHKVFKKEASRGRDIGADALIDLDGLDAYLLIMHAFAFDPLPEDSDHIHYLLLDKLVKMEGEENTRQLTSSLAESDPHVREYLESTWSTWERWRGGLECRKRHVRGAPSYATIRARIDAPGAAISDWGRYADDETLVRLAEDTLVETDPVRLGKYLRQFWHRAFPLDPAPLIALARQESYTGNVVRLAIRALENVTHPSVRDLALDLLQKPGEEFRGIGLLIKNSEPTDLFLITALLEKHNAFSADEYHLIGSAAIRYFEQHPCPEAKDALTALYEHGPCGLCRSRCVEILLQQGVITSDILSECRFDSDAATRRLAETGSRFPVI